MSSCNTIWHIVGLKHTLPSLSLFLWSVYVLIHIHNMSKLLGLHGQSYPQVAKLEKKNFLTTSQGTSSWTGMSPHLISGNISKFSPLNGAASPENSIHLTLEWKQNNHYYIILQCLKWRQSKSGTDPSLSQGLWKSSPQLFIHFMQCLSPHVWNISSHPGQNIC